MMPINWNERLSVNVAEIDQQHKKLLAALNELNDAMKLGKGNAMLGKIVNNLAVYTTTHFQTEENYFDQFEYADADRHKREHAFFAKKVNDFKREIERGKPNLPAEIAGFLSDWLKQHIIGTDKKYSQFFNDKGLK